MTRRNTAGPHRPTFAEPIVPGQLWPIALLHCRLGWGARAVAAARKQGLRVHRWGKRGYVLTDDIIALLTRGGPVGASDSQSAAGTAEARKKHSGNGECCPGRCKTP